MLRNDAVALVAQGLGFRSDINDKIIDRLQQAQRQLEGGQTLPWFIVNEDDAINLFPGQAEYELSDAFIREAEDLGFTSSVSSRGGDYYHVKKVDYSTAVAAYGRDLAGAPQVYALRRDSLRFFPIPDDDYEMRWHFYQRQEVLTTNIENQWLKYAPDLLIAKAGFALATVLRDKDAILHFSSELKIWEAWYLREINARQQANLTVVMGSAQ